MSLTDEVEKVGFAGVQAVPTVVVGMGLGILIALVPVIVMAASIVQAWNRSPSHEQGEREESPRQEIRRRNQDECPTVGMRSRKQTRQAQA